MTRSIDRDEVKRASRLEDVISALTGQQLRTNGRAEPTIACPFHPDEHPSLRVNVEKQVWHCDPCDMGGDVFTFVERYQQTNFVDALRWLAERAGLQVRQPTIVATFDYHDATGQPVYQSYRIEPGPYGRRKTFRQRRSDGHGGWIYNMDGVTRVPYCLHRLQGKSAIFIVEGEGKADRLWNLKPELPATCNVGGTGSGWRDEYSELLVTAGVKRVAVLPDHDEAGHKHANVVAHSCSAAGLQEQIVELPDLPPKGDIIDWLDAGHTREELIALVKTSPVYGSISPTPVAAPESLAPPNAAAVLEALTAFIRRFVALADDQMLTVALWIMPLPRL